MTVQMSGDATIDDSGVVTVAKTGGVAFAASATTNTTNASNITSGALPVAQLPTVPASKGGTGVTTLAAHGLLVGNGAGAVNVTGAGTSGQVLTSNGAAADPTFQAAGGGVSFPLLAPDGTQASPSYAFTNRAGAGLVNTVVLGNPGIALIAGSETNVSQPAAFLATTFADDDGNSIVTGGSAPAGSNLQGGNVVLLGGAGDGTGTTGALLTSTGTLDDGKGNMLVAGSLQTGSDAGAPAPSTITVTASPFSYSPAQYNEQVFISGGIISGITFNGISIAATTSNVILRAGDTLVVTYSGAPTMHTRAF
jgi:hypothetical protein